MLLTYLKLLMNYAARNRALHQLIRETTARIAARKEKLFDPNDKTPWFEGQFAELKQAHQADEKLLKCFEDLWALPGMDPRSGRRQLRGKQYAMALEDILNMLHHVERKVRVDDAELAQEFLAAIEHVYTCHQHITWEIGTKQTEAKADVGLSIFDTEEALRPELTVIEEPVATSDEQLDVPEFMSDDFVPTGA